MAKRKASSLLPVGLVAAVWLSACGASHETLYNRAIFFEEKQAWPQAEKAFREAATKRPDNPKYWNALGLFYAHRGLAVEALECFDRAVDLSRTHGDYRRNRGIVLANLDRLADAETDLCLAASLGAEDAHYYLGRLYMKAERPAEAVAAFEEAMARKSEDRQLAEWVERAREAAGP